MSVTRVLGQRVVEFTEEWTVIDRWWTQDKIERDYASVLLEDGRRVVVMKENGGTWEFVKEEQ